MAAAPAETSRERTFTPAELAADAVLSTEALAHLSRLPLDAFTFEGASDESLITPLRVDAVTRARFNRGGSSVSLRVDLPSGARASFKPDQTNLQSVPRKEVAAYRFSRLLGLRNVAPSVPAVFDRAAVIAALEPVARAQLPRFQAEVPGTRDGKVTGSLAYWIPNIKDCQIQGARIDSLDGIVRWKRYLTVGETMPADLVPLLAQISDMVLFDLVINNFDRWSGSNAKAAVSGDTLYFMDNALSFRFETTGQLKARTYFKRAQKFSRETVAALRALEPDVVRAVMRAGAGPWGALLTEREIMAIFARRDYALAYIDGLIAEHGEDAVLVFP